MKKTKLFVGCKVLTFQWQPGLQLLFLLCFLLFIKNAISKSETIQITLYNVA